MIAITGANGQIGSRVAARLAEHGIEQRLLVRDPSTPPSHPGAEVARYGGYLDADGMVTTLEGVDTVLLISARETEDRVEQHMTAVDAAATVGVERIVYLSFLGAAPDATFTFARHHFETEQYIRESGLAFTFSRQNLYMDLIPYLGGEEGVIQGPADDGRVAPIARDDVADALVPMLLDDGHTGATYELTGSEALTLGEIATTLTEATDSHVEFVNETVEEAYESRRRYGAPDWEVEGWVTTYTAIAAGELNVRTDHVERLTGHRPITLREFLRRSVPHPA